MSVTTEPRTPHNIPTTFDGLTRLHIIRPIRDDVEYHHALEIAGILIDIESMTDDQADYIDLLSEQIERYETKRYGIEPSELTPLEALKFLMEQNEMNGSELGRLLGSRQLGAKILSGERQLSKNHISILAKHFRVSTDLFIE